MTLYENNKFFLCFFVYYFSFSCNRFRYVFRVAPELAVLSVQITEADFRMTFPDRNGPDPAVPLFLLLQITAEIGKICLSQKFLHQ